MAITLGGQPIEDDSGGIDKRKINFSMQFQHSRLILLT